MDKPQQRPLAACWRWTKKPQRNDGGGWIQGLIRSNRTLLTPISTSTQVWLIFCIHLSWASFFSAESPKQNPPRTKPKSKLRSLILSFVQYDFVMNQNPTPNNCSQRFMFSSDHVKPSVFHASNSNWRLLLLGLLTGSEWWKRCALESPALSNTTAAFLSHTY